MCSASEIFFAVTYDLTWGQFNPELSYHDDFRPWEKKQKDPSDVIKSRLKINCQLCLK